MEVVATHRNTDFDALAAAVCATLLYPGAAAVPPNTVNPNVRAFLSLHKDVLDTRNWDDVADADIRRLIVVDVNRWGRLGRIQALRDRKGLSIHLWDHHMVEGDIDADWQCTEPMGATTTLMVREIRRRSIPLTPIQATLFLTGIYEDTGNLLFPATRAEDARAAAHLLEAGADLNVIASFLRPAYGVKQKEILFRMLESAERESVNGHHLSFAKQPVEGHVANLSLVVHMYRQILNVDAAFGIFTDADGRCMVIGRSGAEELDVGSIMRALGGGGHPAAGSAVLKSADAGTVEGMIRDLIRGNQQASVQISDVMSFPVFSIAPEVTMEKAAAILRQRGCTGLPVVEGERLLGILSRRDFRKVRNNAKLSAPVKAFMSREVVTIAPGESPMGAARLMIRHDVGRLPVVEDGRMIGIVTRSDVMTYFYDLLPE